MKLNLALPLFFAFACGASSVSAMPILGSAANFAVLGASTVTNTGPTTIQGNVGVSPGTAITGFPPGVINPPGTTHAADAVAAQAQVDALHALIVLAGQPVTSNLSGQTLGNGGSITTLLPGVYRYNSSAQLNGTLMLNAQNNPNALFIFQIGSTLTTMSGSAINILNGGVNTGVFWEIGSSATLGTSTAFEGNIIANTSITLKTSATILCGRALALTGAVTMDTNTISNDCNTINGGTGNDFGSFGFDAANQNITEPGSLALLSMGLLALTAYGRRSTKGGVRAGSVGMA